MLYVAVGCFDGGIFKDCDRYQSALEPLKEQTSEVSPFRMFVNNELLFNL